MIERIQNAAEWAWGASFNASVLFLLVLLSLTLFRRAMSPSWRYGLCLLVLLRLLLPFAPASKFSIANLAPRPVEASAPIVVASEAAANFDAPAAGVWRDSTSSGDAAATARSLVVAGAELPAAEVGAVDARATLAPAALLGLVWLFGAMAVLLWAGAKHVALMRLLGRAGRPVARDLAALFERCGGRGIDLIEVSGLNTAAAVGVFRPKVILPAGVRATLDDAEIEHVFAHELAHIRRGDLALNWLVVLAASLHWFNPLAWIALRRLLAEREIARDALVVRDQGPAVRSRYGRTLIKVLESFQPAPLSPGAAPVFNSKPEIRRRVTMIAYKHWNSRLAGAFSLILAASLGVATFTSARADDDDEKDEPREERGEREGADRERGERERGERGDREREGGDRERGDRERGEREREGGDRERGERERGGADRERGEREREGGDRERGERERGGADRERGEREREGADRERGEREREGADRERGEREREGGEFERHIDELHQALREAEERGQEDRAHVIRQKLEAAQKAHAQRRAHAERGEAERRARTTERGGDDFERKIDQARRRVGELAEAGKIEEAENLEREIAQALRQREERAVRQERERGEPDHAERREGGNRERERAEHAELLERRLHEMAQRIEELERELQRLRRER